MTRKYKKPHETTPLDAFEQAMKARRAQKEAIQAMNEREQDTTFAPDGLMQSLIERLKKTP